MLLVSSQPHPTLRPLPPCEFSGAQDGEEKGANAIKPAAIAHSTDREETQVCCWAEGRRRIWTVSLSWPSKLAHPGQSSVKVFLLKKKSFIWNHSFFFQCGSWITFISLCCFRNTKTLTLAFMDRWTCQSNYTACAKG